MDLPSHLKTCHSKGWVHRPWAHHKRALVMDSIQFTIHFVIHSQCMASIHILQQPADHMAASVAVIIRPRMVTVHHQHLIWINRCQINIIRTVCTQKHIWKLLQWLIRHRDYLFTKQQIDLRWWINHPIHCKFTKKIPRFSFDQNVKLFFSPVQPDQYAQKSPESFYVGGTGGGGPAHANTPGSSNAEVGGGAAGSHGTNVSNSDKR